MVIGVGDALLDLVNGIVHQFNCLYTMATLVRVGLFQRLSGRSQMLQSGVHMGLVLGFRYAGRQTSQSDCRKNALQREPA